MNQEELSAEDRSQLAKQFAYALADTAAANRGLHRDQRYQSPFVERIVTNGESMEEETLP